MQYLEIGQIVNTSGLKGILKIKPFTDDIKKFSNLKTIIRRRWNLFIFYLLYLLVKCIYNGWSFLINKVEKLD